MADRSRGGNQPPRNPAAVSGPGRLSQRTDGGAGNPRQPIRVPTGGGYGQTGAAQAQQGAAPMAAAPGAPGPQGRGPSGAQGQAGGAGGGAGAFGPTQRPNELLGAGGPAPNALSSNPQAFLRNLYSKFPHPSIERLLDWSANPGEEPLR